MNEEALIENCDNGVASIGNQLADAREAARLSINQVAEKLHLSTRIVEALEANNFTVHPGPIFMRGYLQSYIRLMGLPAEYLLTQFDKLQLQMVRSKPILVSSFIFRPQHAAGERSMRWVTLFVIVGLLVLVGLWWHSHNGTNTANLNPVALVDLPDVIVAEKPKITTASMPVVPAPQSLTTEALDLPASVERTHSENANVETDSSTAAENVASIENANPVTESTDNTTVAVVTPVEPEVVSPAPKPVKHRMSNNTTEAEIF